MIFSTNVPTPRAIAFDLDGTLIDSHGTIARSCNAALVAVGRAPLLDEVIAGFVGDGARLLLSRALGQAPDDGQSADPALLDRTYDAWLAAYVASPVDGTEWMPGALDLLTICTDAHLSIALVTNKPRVATDAILAALGETSRFAAVVGGGDSALKPSPDPIWLAASQLGVAASEMWVVGDGVQDVRAARAAGAFAVAVRGGFSTDEALALAEPHLTTASLYEVAAIVKPLIARRPSARPA